MDDLINSLLEAAEAQCMNMFGEPLKENFESVADWGAGKTNEEKILAVTSYLSRTI